MGDNKVSLSVSLHNTKLINLAIFTFLVVFYIRNYSNNSSFLQQLSSFRAALENKNSRVLLLLLLLFLGKTKREVIILKKYLYGYEGIYQAMGLFFKILRILHPLETAKNKKEVNQTTMERCLKR